MIIGHVVKLDPTPRQQRELLSHIGAARFSYNTMLSYVNDNYDKGTGGNCQRNDPIPPSPATLAPFLQLALPPCL